MSRFFSTDRNLAVRKRRKREKGKLKEFRCQVVACYHLIGFRYLGGNGFSSVLVFLDSEAAAGGNRPETEAEEKEEI